MKEMNAREMANHIWGCLFNITGKGKQAMDWANNTGNTGHMLIAISVKLEAMADDLAEARTTLEKWMAQHVMEQAEELARKRLSNPGYIPTVDEQIGETDVFLLGERES